MAATIEIKYYNSFWLKKIASITAVNYLNPQETDANTAKSTGLGISGTNTVQISNASATSVGIGQTLSYSISSIPYTNTIIYKNIGTTDTILTLLTNITGPDIVVNSTILTFGKIINNAWLPSAYSASNDKDWHIEEARIRGGYNNTSVDFGVKAYLVEDFPQRENLISTMIFSGVFNSKTGVNNTNQFSVADDITRMVDPAQGSIQKLYAEDTNLTVFQELKVSRALIDKDAIYSADGQPMTTSGSSVIGQIQSYAGNYGIGKHPESFAVYGYRKYFTDDYQNVVLRLSQDGITEISSYGMFDYFRDKLSNTNLTDGYLFGVWDAHSKQYVLSIQPSQQEGVTLAFDEDSNGWTSFFSYVPNQGISLRNSYYTFHQGKVYKHYSPNVPRAQFYENEYKSNVTLVFNPNVSQSKSFLTVNYEGTPNWNLTSYNTETDTCVPITSYSVPRNSSELQNQLFSNNFKSKENKYFANILNTTALAQGGEILYGNSISGIKGFYATAVFSCDNATVVNINAKAELFAVSSEYVESSY
jgi:hypothetical protein